MSQRKCQSNNPSTCKYHGTVSYHKSVRDNAQDKYLGLMRDALGFDRNASAAYSEKIEKAKVAYEEAQALVDAHDEEFEALQAEVERVNKIPVAVWDWDFYTQRLDLVKRLNAAEEVRRGREAEEKNPAAVPIVPAESDWTSGYVKDIPAGAVVASGAVVVDVRRRLNLKANQREVLLKHPNGKQTLHVWNANTKINFKVEKKPVLNEKEIADAWGPAAS